MTFHSGVRHADFEHLTNTLGLSDEAMSRIGSIGRPGRHVVLPDDADADALMQAMNARPVDRTATLAARPDPDADPELWEVLALLVDELAVTMDQGVPVEGFRGWPPLPASLGAVGRHLYTWALLAATPAVRRVHAARGIDDAVSWATLSALGAVMATHRQVTGESGLGLFTLWSPPLQFRGADYHLGRHDFTRAALAMGDGAEGHVLMVHVPPSGPLDPQDSGASLDRAREFFPRHYPEEPVTAFTCRSWLLDPQLADYLPPDSNIMRFQRRFTYLLPWIAEADPAATDREMLELALGRQHAAGEVPEEVLAELPQQTTLQRAFVAHLRGGGHWHKRTGWSPWPDG